MRKLWPWRIGKDSDLAIKLQTWGNAALVRGSQSAAYNKALTTALYTPAVAGSIATVPDNAALDITTDLDIRVLMRMTGALGAGNNRFISKWGASGNFSWALSFSSTTIRMMISTTGANTLTKSATVSLASVGIVANTLKWLRATVDVNNGAAGYDVAFYYSDDGSTWTQLGTTVTTATAITIFSGSGNLGIGADPDGVTSLVAFPIKLYKLQIFNSLDGSNAKANWDFTTGPIGRATITDSVNNLVCTPAADCSIIDGDI